jgi:hypothetical protein
MTIEQAKKLKFNLVNLFLETQKEIVQIQQKVKGFSVLVAGSTLIASNEHNMILVMVGFFVVDLIIGCFRIE